MTITTLHTLRFTITSPNPPHTTACEFIKAACVRTATACKLSSAPLPADAGLETRSSIVEIECDEREYLEQLGSNIADAMQLIGVEVSDEPAL
jgi:hypothetical protein